MLQLINTDVYGNQTYIRPAFKYKLTYYLFILVHFPKLHGGLASLALHVIFNMEPTMNITMFQTPILIIYHW